MTQERTANDNRTFLKFQLHNLRFLNISSLFLPREKKLSTYVPAHVAMGSGGLFSTLRGKSSRQAGLEQNLLEEYKKFSTTAQSSPEPKQILHQYLHTCHTLPYYG